MMDTAEQILLPFSDPADAPAEPKTIQAKFEAFLEQNPQVWSEFVGAAHRLRSLGFTRYSARGIYEGLRFTMHINGRDASGYKLNNNYTSRLSRRLVEQDETFRDFFELREIRSE
jgi:hypothetical protein